MEIDNNIFDWPKVLSFEELTQFIDRKYLVELSLTNHILRDKLSPLIFRSISLSSYSIVDHLTSPNGNNSYSQALEEYIEYNSGVFEYNYDKPKSKDLEHDSMAKILGDSLLRIKKHVKSFKLDQLFSSCCFAFPLVYDFINLEKLEIYCSSIYYNDLINLGDKFEKLKDLILIATLMFNYSKKTEVSMFNLPKTLESIEMLQCKKYRSSSTDSIIDNDSHISNNTASRIEMLFPIHIPSLKRLRICNFKYFEDYLKTYLKLNPQLEALEIISDFAAQDQVDYIANECPNLTELYISHSLRDYEELSIPTFHYIKKLKFGDFGLNNFVILQKLCENCPELDHLVLNINEDAYSKELDKFLKTSAPRLQKLNTLEVNILSHFEWPSMNFRELKNIQNLIIGSPSIFEINANQLPPQRLKVKIECSVSGKILNYINNDK
jgi:hypothetical protein